MSEHKRTSTLLFVVFCMNAYVHASVHTRTFLPCAFACTWVDASEWESQMYGTKYNGAALHIVTHDCTCVSVARGGTHWSARHRVGLHRRTCGFKHVCFHPAPCGRSIFVKFIRWHFDRWMPFIAAGYGTVSNYTNSTRVHPIS